MGQLSNLGATSELEALNTLLRAAGEAPVDTIDTSVVDVRMALDLLRATSREVQLKGWRFNTEHGYEVVKAADFVWTDRVYGTATLSIFKPPTNLLSFSVTSDPWQQGTLYTDIAIRPSRVYKEAGLPVMVFYDRLLNRDGWEGRDQLYINPTWLLDFDLLPEPARQYITIRAARRYCQQIVGSGELGSFTDRDELMALRDLRRTEGAIDNYNVFQNYSVTRTLGGRPLGPSGFIDGRSSPGHA